MISAAYRAQVDLLIRILPQVAAESVFALKGGTAINLFVRDMPRFSVDIDLTYLPINDRKTALHEIADGLRRIKQRIDKAIQGVSTLVATQSGGQEAKLICQLHKAIVKIEVNTVIRGHLWPTRNLALSQPTQDEFKKSARISVVSHAELFGGKICAALDRQHPRDLFDIQQLYEHEGLSDEVRLGFIVSLLSHTRPMHELLRPQLTDQRRVYNTQFAGMPFIPYSYEDFESTRERRDRLAHKIASANWLCKMLQTTVSFLGREDHALIDKLLAELPGILLWAIEGWRRLRKRGHFIQPNDGCESLDAMTALASPVKAFVADCCEFDTSAEISVSDLYDAYHSWCDSQGQRHVPTKQTFGRDLCAAFPQLRLHRPSISGHRARLYQGLKLATEPEA